MKRIDYYGRSFTVSDTFATALVAYLDAGAKAGRPLGEFFRMRCYTEMITGTGHGPIVDVTLQIVAGVPLLVYPADDAFAGVAEINDNDDVLAALA